MSEEYRDYVGEIIIEGHTDTQGTYLVNLELSQERALSVATYCLQMPTLSEEQLEKAARNPHRQGTQLFRSHL